MSIASVAVLSRERNFWGMLPDMVKAEIFKFLTLYELVGLGRVSKEFRDFLRSYYGYDPFAAYTNAALEPNRHKLLPSTWTNLGIYSPRADGAIPEPINAAVNEAYAFIGETLAKELADGTFGQPAELKIQWTGSSDEQQRKATGFKNLNCVAAITMGNSTVRAVNFITQIQRSDLQAVHGGFRPQIDYKLVESRHAEWRLLTKMLIAQPFCSKATADLFVDKMCCIFCTMQMIAIGRTDLIIHDPKAEFKPLKWYNFAPVVIFFEGTRRELWGDAVEEVFKTLDPDSKQVFLYELAKKAQKPDPVNKALRAARKQIAESSDEDSENLPDAKRLKTSTD